MQEYADSLLEDFNDPGDSWGDPEWGEAFPRYRPSLRGGRINIPLPRPAQSILGLRGGSIQTPGGGRAQVTLPAAVATKDAVEAAVKELKADIARNADAIRKVNQSLDTNTAMLDRKITATQKAQQQSAFSAMLPMLMTKPPELKALQLSGGSLTNVDKTEYKPADSMGLMLAMMMMSGGMGGSGSDNNSTMMMALALGAFK